jgi:hypothetical protein
MNFPRACVGISVLLALACTDQPFPTANSESTRMGQADPAYQLAAAANGRMERGTEDDILRLENALPGLGGVFLQGSKLVVYVPAGMSRSEALERLAIGATTLNLPPDLYQQMTRGENIELRPARYPFSRLVSWVASGIGGIMRLPGVTGIDANEATNKVTLFVRDESFGAPAVAAAHAAGLPFDAVETRVAAPILTSGLQGTWNPTGGGIQIQNETSHDCSMGFNDRWNDVKGFWTAGHCSKYALGVGTGDLITQPSGVDPVSWTPHSLWRRSLRCRGVIQNTRPSFAGRSWSCIELEGAFGV